MSGTRQLAFPFPPHDVYRSEFLAAPCNADALAWLARPAQWPAGRLAVFGAQGSGKTHLLHASGATVLAGATLRGLPDLPDPPAAGGGIAVDDADRVPEAEALLHLLNRAGELGRTLLLAASDAPSRWPVRLPDLASRLRATAAVELGLPDDRLLHALLGRLIAQRQLRVEEGVRDYLLARLPRHGTALREAVEQLDRLSLQAGRAVTRAVAAEALARLGGEPSSRDGAGLV